MPGGDLATKEPWRMALSYLQSIYGEVPDGLKVCAGIADNQRRLVTQAIERKINAPLTSSCGRLFDAVSAILGLRQTVSFEGQAAMQLEMIADPAQSISYPCLLLDENDQILYNPTPMIASIVNDQLAGLGVEKIAGRFHFSMAAMIEEVCSELRQRTGLNRVVLSGGVFQNCLLTEMALARLGRSGFEVITHSLVPPNDGGLALGQAVIAAA
jgi:hydrogenase maturation protein HypF